MSTIYLDGESLTPRKLYELGYNEELKLEIAESAWERIQDNHNYLISIIQSGKKTYGINTGVGYFSDVAISEDKLKTLQKNLIKSHSVGVGPSFTIPRTKMILALRINILCKGCSGTSPQLIRKLVEAFNKGCFSYVPEQGTVGACGDLAPLAHLFIGLMGEGLMWDEDTHSYIPALEVLAKKNYEPVQELLPKEGLTMINGPQIITSLLSEGYHRGMILAEAADIIAALTIECLRSLATPFDERIHMVRPHFGQLGVAKRLKALLLPISEIASNTPFEKVQDAYSLRCIPQVHGPAWDTLKFVNTILTTELNSATDNPLIFHESMAVISGGNFHGEYTAKMSDFLAIALHELGSISEVRISRLMRKDITGFEFFLVHNPGLNSGLMMAHCTAASLVSENKQLCHPASVDTIPTSAGQEDHVSMGGWAARKLLRVIDNIQNILAVELLSDLHALKFLRPHKSTEALEKVIALAEGVTELKDSDYFISPDIQALSKLIGSGALSEAVREYWE